MLFLSKLKEIGPEKIGAEITTMQQIMLTYRIG